MAKSIFLISSFAFLFVAFNLAGCGEGAKGQQKAKKADAMEIYRSQDHRFEIRGCQLFYNEQHVVLVSLHNIEDIFGKNYYTDGYSHKYYTDKPVDFYIEACKVSEEFRACVERLNILMSHKEGVRYDLSDSYDSIMSLRPALEGYILFDGVLVDANTKVEDLNRQLEANGKYPLGSSWGNQASQAIRYDDSACVPAYNCISPCLTVVKLYYYEDNISGEPTTIQSFRYEY